MSLVISFDLDMEVNLPSKFLFYTKVDTTQRIFVTKPYLKNKLDAKQKRRDHEFTRQFVSYEKSSRRIINANDVSEISLKISFSEQLDGFY